MGSTVAGHQESGRALPGTLLRTPVLPGLLGRPWDILLCRRRRVRRERAVVRQLNWMRPCALPLLRSAATGLFIVPRHPRYPLPPLFAMLPAPECFEPRASLYIYMKRATVGRRREAT